MRSKISFAYCRRFLKSFDTSSFFISILMFVGMHTYCVQKRTHCMGTKAYPRRGYKSVPTAYPRRTHGVPTAYPRAKSPFKTPALKPQPFPSCQVSNLTQASNSDASDNNSASGNLKPTHHPGGTLLLYFFP